LTIFNVNNSTKQSPGSEHKRLKKFAYFYSICNVECRFYRSLPLDSILSQMNPVCPSLHIHILFY